MRLNIKILFAAALLALAFASPGLAAQACGQDGHSICDISSQNGQVIYSNCQQCPMMTPLYCASGPLSAQQTCQSNGFSPTCANVALACTSGGSPNKVLTFKIYNKQDLVVNITPSRRSNIAGRATSYTVQVVNKNPVSLNVLLEVLGSDNWQFDIPQSMQVGANANNSVTLKVTSPMDTDDGDYPIKVNANGIQTDNNMYTFSGTSSAIYQVASRAAPSVSFDAATQTGIPGQKITYAINITNNDPTDFDASTMALDASGPSDWTVSLASRSVSLKPGESKVVNMDVTSSKNATQNLYSISVNASVNGLDTLAQVQYAVTLCGDGVCNPLESSCQQDCPLESNFLCNGRCEQQTDTGVDFSTTVKFPFSTFIVCSKDSTPDQCKSAYNSKSCGFGKACLCGTTFGSSQCSLRCVDGSGAYYLYATATGTATGQRSLANYSFDCPFVNLDEIKSVREDFNTAMQDFQQSQSGIQESLNTATTDEKQTLLPCYSGLDSIISQLKTFIAYLDAVIKYPAVSNTTEARSRIVDMRSTIDSEYSMYCKGATGALRIAGISTPSTVEKGKDITGSISIRNTGGITYYGYATCDFTSPKGTKNTTNTTCTPFSPGQQQSFSLDAYTDTEGTWQMQCKVIGSLKQDCSSEVHDQSNVITFSVYSRDTFVKDVSGSCSAQGSSCTVRLSNNFDCAGCMIDGRECTRQSQTNDTTIFSCPRGVPGKYNLTAYVIPTDLCNPVSPNNKTVQVACEGCGDGIVSDSEQCELPSTDNNKYCGQTQADVTNGRRGARDQFGYCTAQCQCSLDPFNYSCVKGVGGATCNDGDTQIYNTIINGKNASCTQQCGATCIWDNCTPVTSVQCSLDTDCPMDQACINNICTLIQHGCLLDTDCPVAQACISGYCAARTACNSDLDCPAPLTCTNHNCTQPPCSFDSDCSTGQVCRSGVCITASASTGSQTQQNATVLQVSVSHSPLNPKDTDNVAVTATGTGAISVFVDGLKKIDCDVSPCAYQQQYLAGQHTYFAVTREGLSVVADPAEGMKMFTVTSGQTSQNQSITQKNQSTTTNSTVQIQGQNISLSISHAPASPVAGDTVSFTASASAIMDSIDIYIDSQPIMSCSSAASCYYAQKLPAGQHDYYALFTKGSTTSRIAGSVLASQPMQNNTQPEQNNPPIPSTTTNSTVQVQSQNISMSVSNTPTNPVAGENVFFAATASAAVDRIDVFLDSGLVMSCKVATACYYAQKLVAGGHDYYALFTKGTVTSKVQGLVFASQPVATQNNTQPEQNNTPIPGTTTNSTEQVQGQNISMTVSNTPTNPVAGENVFFTATASAFMDNIQIFLDSAPMTSCKSSASCYYAQKLPAGQHDYYALFTKGGITSKVQGSVSASQPATPPNNAQPAANNTQPIQNATVNVTVIAANQSFSAAVHHIPDSPNVGDNVTIIAVSNITLDRIQIYVDGFAGIMCNMTSQCMYSQVLGAGSHDYYGLFTKNATTARVQNSVFVSMPLVPKITAIDTPDNVIYGSNSYIDVAMNNPSIPDFAKLSCVVRTPSQARSVSSQCFQLPQLDSTQRMVFIANELGTWNVTSCSLNVSARSDCYGAQVTDVRPGTAFAVIQPTDVFIGNVVNPQTIVVGSSGSMNVTLQNPMGSSRFARAACTLNKPDGSSMTLQSDCLGLSLNSSRTYNITIQADQLGTWQVSSCSSYTSLSSDCSSSSLTQTETLSSQISVVKSNNLDIVTATLSSSAIIIGDTVSADVLVANPTGLDRFAEVACTFRTQNQANLINGTDCSPVKMDQQAHFIVTVKPPFVGTWNVTQCGVAGSLNVDCAQSKADDTFGPVGMFTVSSASQTSGESGGSTANSTASLTGNCQILRFLPSCSFSAATSRYVVSAQLSWTGGDHAHVIIGDDSGSKIYDQDTVVSKSLAVPGLVKVSAEVHNSNDQVLCSAPSQDIYCFPGNASAGPGFTISRNVNAVQGVAPFPVQLIAGATDDIDNFTLVENVDPGLNISNIIVTGNMSNVLVLRGFATSVNFTGTLQTITFSTPMTKGQNITFSYTALPAGEGDYKLFYQANASGNYQQEDVFDIFATNCPQKTQVWATGPGGSCQQFRTVCDQPAGWTTVDQCPVSQGCSTDSDCSAGEVCLAGECSQQASSGNDSLMAIVVIVIIALVAFLAYRNRDAIRERLSRLHHAKGPQEELPTFDKRE